MDTLNLAPAEYAALARFCERRRLDADSVGAALAHEDGASIARRIDARRALRSLAEGSDALLVVLLRTYHRGVGG